MSEFEHVLTKAVTKPEFDEQLIALSIKNYKKIEGHDLITEN
jgi:hypothetical protein